jgi:hypothetical protein
MNGKSERVELPPVLARPPVSAEVPHHRLHFSAAETIAEYIGETGIETSTVFQVRRAPHSQVLGKKPMSEAQHVSGHAGYVKKRQGGQRRRADIQHYSLWDDPATLLLDAGESGGQHIKQTIEED